MMGMDGMIKLEISINVLRLVTISFLECLSPFGALINNHLILDEYKFTNDLTFS